MYLDGKRCWWQARRDWRPQYIEAFVEILSAHAHPRRFHEKMRHACARQAPGICPSDFAGFRIAGAWPKGCDSVFMAAAQTGGAQAAVLEPWRQVTEMPL
jgi:hypothetical protein